MIENFWVGDQSVKFASLFLELLQYQLEKCGLGVPISVITAKVIIIVEGKPLVANLDIAKENGGDARRPVVRELRNVEIDGALDLSQKLAGELGIAVLVEVLHEVPLSSPEFSSCAAASASMKAASRASSFSEACASSSFRICSANPAWTMTQLPVSASGV